jgi:dihydrofolate reductase
MADGGACLRIACIRALLFRMENVGVIRGNRSNDGPDLIVWGSTTLTSVLFEQGLVDDLMLIVYPVLLGRGKRFFSESTDPRTRFRQHQGHAFGRSAKHVSIRWVAANPNFADVSG